MGDYYFLSSFLLGCLVWSYGGLLGCDKIENKLSGLRKYAVGKFSGCTT